VSVIVPAGASRDKVVRACPDLPAMAKVANPGGARAVSLRRIMST